MFVIQLLINMDNENMDYKTYYANHLGEEVDQYGVRIMASTKLKMNANPKGRAVIFVTLPELANEAERFKSIFTKLLFESDVYSGLTCDGFKNKLSELANTDTYNGDLFIMMFIGKGYNEHIIGRTDTSQWPPNECNIMAISEIVATFGWTRSPALRHKSKVFIFNCDRIKIASNVCNFIVTNSYFNFKRDGHLLGPIESPLINKLTMLNPKFDVNKEQTHVIYACCEDVKPNGNRFNG
ncbi:unnamed protein product [Medioppia subpectinata]|uniref:Caspase family p20 domain-containing protein n=1 Tax=Medioppia subpectinata TaxID=1979941 RepID=A0A7R9KBH1_9ACAR|nr:unnamed protein product [Medioppia subpectinata]CAG2100391.1 unnamed protein product [Medioppia subpectinata]